MNESKLQKLYNERTETHTLLCKVCKDKKNIKETRKLQKKYMELNMKNREAQLLLGV